MSRIRLALLVALLALAAVPVAAARAHRHSVAAVRVTMSEFKFVLTRKSVPKGAVTFTVVNGGKISHDFWIDGKKTRILAPKKTAKLVIRFTKAGKYPYRCTVDSHAKFGMKGVLTVT
jgi:uncharacterized cupredoxin-like copper-binding protein